MEFRVLGTMRAIGADGADRAPTAPRSRTLLAVLLVNRGRTVRLDELSEAIWGPRPPRSHRNLLQGYVRDLRRAIGDDRIRTDPEGYRLALRPEDTVDVDRLRGSASEMGLPATQGHWSAPPLPGWSDEPWARAFCARVEEEQAIAAERSVARTLEEGRPEDVVGILRELVDRWPLREELWALLVTALDAAGRRAEAHDALRRARRTMWNELGIEPGEHLASVADTLWADHPRGSGWVAGRDLPRAATPLLGRAREVAEATRLLAEPGLLTITGPGGAGKTRLAVEVVHAPHISHRICFVDLVPARRQQDVEEYLAAALEVTTTTGSILDAVAGYLDQQPVVLVLDNCEQVADGAAAVVRSLCRRCPNIRVLATSREPLRLDGERVIRLSGVDTASGMELFAQRSGIRFAPGSEPERIVRHIVDRLDRLPLAIELAATRVTALSLGQVADALAEPLHLLQVESRSLDPRHRSMRAVIGWSHRLLDPADREALAALAVFVGPFSVRSAGAAMATEPTTAALALDRLLSRALVTRVADVAGEARYRVPEPVRQFAVESADPALLRRAAAGRRAAMNALAHAVDRGLRTSRSPTWAAAGRSAAPDLEAVAAGGSTDRTADARSGSGRLVADLAWLWFIDGRLRQLHTWLESAQGGDPHTRMRLLRAQASASMARGDVHDAEAAAVRLAVDAAEAGDDALTALGHGLHGMSLWARGDPRAVAVNHLALRHARRCHDPWTRVLVTAVCARTVHAMAGQEAGRRLLAEAVRLGEGLGEPLALGLALDYSARAALHDADPKVADSLVRQALEAYREIGYLEGIASAATLAGIVRLRAGDLEGAETLLREALDRCRRIGHPGGVATVLEASALVDEQRGDRVGARRALRTAREMRASSRTSTPGELADAVVRLGRALAD